MRILVTGGAGFVGTNLIKSLVQEKHCVFSIDNYSTGLESNHQQECNYLNHDIRSLQDYSNIKPDVVFHLAAIARIQPSFDKPKEYFSTNANGTLNIAHYCAENNIPLIYAGSSSKHSGRFKNPYTFSKDIGEDIIKLYQQHYGLKASIARFYNVYGPHQLTEGGYTTLIGRWLNNIEKGLPCEIYGDGEQRRDFTHVDDIVNGLEQIMYQQAYDYEFELGRGKNYSVNEIAKLMNITPVYRDAKPGEARHTLDEDTTARDVLGWVAIEDIEDYLKEVLK